MTGDVDIVILKTAVAVETLCAAVARSIPEQRFLDSLADITTLTASPAAGEALRTRGVTPTLELDASATWRHLLTAVDQCMRVTNSQVAIEQTADVHSISAGLEARGARVTRLAIFDSPAPENPQVIDHFFDQLDRANDEAILFTSAQNATQFCALAQQFRRARLTSHLLDRHIVLTVGSGPAEILADHGVVVDYQTDAQTVSAAVAEIAASACAIRQQKHIIRVQMSGPASHVNDENAPWYNSPFMKACRGERTDVTPIWMMRQAGRYMKEYRAVRDKVSFLELCANPQLCSEVMCHAVQTLGVDAAIIFSDLLPILVPMGLDLEFVIGDGPVIHNPVRSAADVDRVKRLENNDELMFVMDTVTQTRNDLPADMPLIGFAGAPFTLASYMIEGGASKNYANTKALMFSDAGAWRSLMERLSDSISIYLNGQVKAGAQCLQLFDSWAGALSYEDYRQFVHPYVQQIIASVPRGVPVINFATGNPALLPLLADTQASVVGIDWRVRLDDAWDTVGHDMSVQGNLDQTVLLTNPDEIRKQAKIVLDQAAGRPGHIFNLGHGILPQTPVDNAIALVDIVHELSSK
jgi:uroporphyrinogen decarboxylase